MASKFTSRAEVTLNARFSMFVDRPEIKRKLTRWQRVILSRTGAYGRQVMRNQIKSFPQSKSANTVVDPFVQGVYQNISLDREQEMIRRKKTAGKGWTMYHVPKKGKGLVTDARTGRPVTTAEASYARTLLAVKQRKMTRRDASLGRPPRNITGKLKRNIFYGIEFSARKGSVLVIGAWPFTSQPPMVQRVSVPQVLNQGGHEIIHGRPVYYAPRPFVETVYDVTFDAMQQFIMQTPVHSV